MLNMRWGVALSLSLAFVAINAGAADVVKVQEKEVKALVRDLYSKRLSELEAWKGRKASKKACEYLKSIFDPQLIKNEALGCDVAGSRYFRFPTIESEDMGYLADENRLPRARIVSVAVNGVNAVVKVIAPIDKDILSQGRVVYFFKKTEQGWRISNMLAYQQYPLDLSGEFKDCGHQSGNYRFALPPTTAADFEDLPPACRDLELAARHRNGWGK